MGFNLTAYTNAERLEVNIDLPDTDEVLTVGYYPRKLSTAAFAKAERESRFDGLELAARDGLVDTIVAVAADWNVTDDAGNPVPLTRENVASLSDELLGHILNGLMGHTPKASKQKRRG